MSKYVRLTLFLLLVAMLVVGSVATVSATRHDIQGLVFIDDNLNGVWDEGEAGYEGVMQWDEDLDVMRYVGATVTVLTPAYEEYEVETLGFRELEENEAVVCTQQDLVMSDGDLNPNPVRPCFGTYGLPLTADDTYLEISLQAAPATSAPRINPFAGR